MEVATGGSSGHVDANAPDYIRNPHRLPMSHVLFTDGNLAREVLAKQTLQSTPENDQDGVTKESAALHSRAGSRLSDWPRFQCTTCHLKLPNEHLLDIHVLEVHDSFFAAQAARHMKVFQCLVEGCAKTFHSPADRRKHLWDQHCYPRDFNYHLMHLGKHQGQYGPRKEPQHLVPAILESMEAVTESQFDAQSKVVPELQHEVSTTEGGKATQSSMHMSVQQSRQSYEVQKKRPGAESAMDIDDLAHGLSRLGTASRNLSHVPRSITFGRRGK